MHKGPSNRERLQKGPSNQDLRIRVAHRWKVASSMHLQDVVERLILLILDAYAVRYLSLKYDN